jgi:DNA polymerase V
MSDIMEILTAPELLKNELAAEKVNLDKLYVRHPLSTFIVDYSGDSMINAFIPPRARLLVDRAVEAGNGDIILAVLNGVFTVKYLRKNDHKCWLVPANRKYNPVEVSGNPSFRIWGVVTAIMIEPQDIASSAF